MLQGPQITGTPGIATVGLFHHVLHACCMLDIHLSVRPSVCSVQPHETAFSLVPASCLRQEKAQTEQAA